MQGNKGVKGNSSGQVANIQQQASANQQQNQNQQQTTQINGGTNKQDLTPNSMHIEQQNNGQVIDPSKLSGMIFADQYQLMEKLGSGAFGVIYKTKYLKEDDTYYGCKVERADTKHPQIIFEARLYNYLHNNPSRPAQGIPKCYHFDRYGDYNFMVMDLLGNSLEQLFCSSGRQFSLKTVLMLADQMIQRVEYLHTRNFLHRDIKPDNFLIGTGKREGRVYMIDFGLAKRYIRDGEHIQYKDGKNLTGTARYASISTHVGIEQSRRDDLESLAYVFLYFLKGQLPWQNIRAKDKKEKYEKIKQKKETTSVEELCVDLPSEFAWFLNYSKSLKFTDKPDYTRCRQVFKDLMIRNNFTCDHQWDWKIKEEQNKTSINGNNNNLLLMNKKQVQNANQIQNNNNQNGRNSNNDQSAIINQNQTQMNSSQVQNQQQGVLQQMQQSTSFQQQQQQQQRVKYYQNMNNNLNSSQDNIPYQQQNNQALMQRSSNLQQNQQANQHSPQQAQFLGNNKYIQGEQYKQSSNDHQPSQIQQQQISQNNLPINQLTQNKQYQNQKSINNNMNSNQLQIQNQQSANSNCYFDNNTSLFNYINNPQYMQNQDSFVFFNGNNGNNNGVNNNTSNGIQNILNSSNGMILTDAQQQQLIYQQQQYLESQNNSRNIMNAKNSQLHNQQPINSLPQQFQLNQQTSTLAKQGNSILNNNYQYNLLIQSQQSQQQQYQQHQQQQNQLLRSSNQYVANSFNNLELNNNNNLNNSPHQNNNKSGQLHQQYMNYQQLQGSSSANPNLSNYYNTSNLNQQQIAILQSNNHNNNLLGNNSNICRENNNISNNSINNNFHNNSRYQ